MHNDLSQPLRDGAFLLGASRSGSTLMSQLLNMHPEILSLSEFFAMQGSRALLPGRVTGRAYWQQLARPTRLLRRLTNPDTAPHEFLYHKVPGGRFDPYCCPPIQSATLPHLFSDPDSVFDRLAPQVAAFPRQSRADHVAGLIDVLAAETQRSFWVERSGGSLIQTQLLHTLFPQAKFALILRDGRDVALSMAGFKPIRFVIKMWLLLRRLGIDMLNPKWPIGRARLIAMLERSVGSLVPVGWFVDQEPSLKDAAEFWSQIMQRGYAQFLKIPERQRHCFWYEDLVAQPEQTLGALATFFEISAPAQWVAQASKIPEFRPSKQNQLSSEQLAILNKGTAPALHLGKEFARAC